MKQLKPEPREIKVYTPKDIRDGIVSSGGLQGGLHRTAVLRQPQVRDARWVPEHTAAPAQTTLADPKHFAHRLFDSGLPGPSGSHGAYYKGRPRSYEPYVFESNGQDSDGQNSD